MANQGPLSHPRLRVIEETLNAGDLDGAQRLLADLGEGSAPGVAMSYFATRLLFLRGRRIDPKDLHPICPEVELQAPSSLADEVDEHVKLTVVPRPVSGLQPELDSPGLRQDVARPSE